MFEDLIEKLKASVEELRKKLPGGGGDDDDDDEYEDDDYEDKYHADEEDDDDDDGKTVKVQVTDLLEKGELPSGDDEDEEAASPKEKTQKIYAEDDDDDDEYDDDEDAEEAAQKRKKLIMYGGVAALVIVLVLPEFMPKDEEIAPAPVVKRKKRPRKKRKKPKKKVAAPKADTAKPKPAPPVEKPKVADVPPETATGLPDKIESAPVAQPEPTVAPPPTVTQPEPTVAPPVVAEPAPAQPAPEKPKMEQPTDDGSLDIQLGEEKPMAPKGPDTKLSDMASKIEKKLEYVAPPNYERSGRGLVYNCVGKHWACVDKFSYLTCRENTKWSGQNNKKPECATKNVYASVEDCNIIQKHYIESSEPSDFCEGTKPQAEVQNVDDTSEEIDLLE